MPRILLPALAATALALSASAGWAQQSPSSPPPPPPAPTTVAMPYMQVAGESDVFEITSSQMAVMKSADPEVRAFAEMLIQHHTMTTNVLLAQAKAAGLTPPPAVLGPQKRAMIDELIAAPADGFDAVYLRQQIPAHEQTLALHTTYAETGDTPELRVAATGAVPFVTRHLEDARRMAEGASVDHRDHAMVNR